MPLNKKQLHLYIIPVTNQNDIDTPKEETGKLYEQID
jgi:hypothetical protein